ncbi:MAG TPA: hypothetical protein VFR23_20705 [Jiangellaceae bacterium]|nr:hypothetical protein [Jiangellaceae bacterium]
MASHPGIYIDISTTAVPTGIRASVVHAISKMDWLTESDAGLRALAIRLATEIELVADRAKELAALQREVGDDGELYQRIARLEAQCDAVKVLGWLGPQLHKAMVDLGGAPESRKRIALEGEESLRLKKLREAAQGAAR